MKRFGFLVYTTTDDYNDVSVNIERAEIAEDGFTGITAIGDKIHNGTFCSTYTDARAAAIDVANAMVSRSKKSVSVLFWNEPGSSAEVILFLIPEAEPYNGQA
jgi:hypothetical protein